ncbi:helix-turn-helix domain-containing protein [Paenibacillus elgii]
MQFNLITPNIELWRIENTFENIPHAHDDFYQITIPVTGTCRLTQERRVYLISGGHALIQHPGEEHHFSLGPDGGVYIVQVRKQLLVEGGSEQEPELASRPLFNPEDIKKRMNAWTSELLLLDGPDPLAVEETEGRVLAYIQCVVGKKGSRVSGGLNGRHADRAIVSGMTDVLEFIHAHYTERLTMERLAALVYQSKFHFIRSFTQTVGVTPYQYILRLRIEQAKEQLARTRASVTEISYSLGFSSPSQLYRAFAKATGVTPEQYRKGTAPR